MTWSSNQSFAYCEQFIKEPKKTLFILITDLSNEAQLVRRMGEMRASGVKPVCLLALSDAGAPSYEENLARQLAALGNPCFACTSARPPDLVEGALRGADLTKLPPRRSRPDSGPGDQLLSVGAASSFDSASAPPPSPAGASQADSTHAGASAESRLNCSPASNPG